MLHPEMFARWLEEAIEPYCSIEARTPILRQQKDDRDRMAGLAAMLRKEAGE